MKRQSNRYTTKLKAKLSPPILNNMGVNQGGIASGFLFRKYMTDLGPYLSWEYGVVISDEIIAHLLWLDDLMLFSDTQHGIQKQLEGLHTLAMSIIMWLLMKPKQKACVSGSPPCVKYISTAKLLNKLKHINASEISYALLKKWSGRLCCQLGNYNYPCDQSRKAIFSVRRIIRLLLMYDIDIWEYNKSGTQVFDKLSENFVRYTLHIKATTSKSIVYGECGRFPQSVYCHINLLCYYRRRLGMSENIIS